MQKYIKIWRYVEWMILIKMPSLEAVEIFNNVTVIEPQYPWRETK